MVPKKQYYENVAATIIKNLEKRRMNGFYCADKESAIAKVLELIPAGSSVGWGGSMTLKENGFFDALADANSYQIIDRDTAKTKEEEKIVYEFGCDSMQGFLYDKPIPVEDFERKYVI